jgi:hypothetical protein
LGGVPRQIEELFRGAPIHLAGKFRLLGASGVAHDGCKVYDSVDPRERLRHRVDVADICLNEFETLVPVDPKQRLSSKQQKIESPNSVTPRQKMRYDD